MTARRRGGQPASGASRARRGEDPLRAALDAVQPPSPAALARDPLRFPRRYLDRDPADLEIAAVFAALLAFGRVELFGAVLERLFAEMDEAGGPAAWCARCVDGPVPTGHPLVYRWFGRTDFVALGVALHRLSAAEGLAAAFSGGLEHGVTRLRALAPRPGAPTAGPGRDDLASIAATSPQAQAVPGRFFDTWFPVPSSGSACKRWCMFLRWMVRTGAPDLGRWTHLSPAQLVMPVDTHVLRIARLTGLTARKTADWKTALEITGRLRAFAPDDPTRYDFALAHLGISSGCTGSRSPACDGCGMRSVCRAFLGVPPGGVATSAPPSAPPRRRAPRPRARSR